MRTIKLAGFDDTLTLPATYKKINRKNVIKFSPSIAHYKDDKYLLTSRVWISQRANTNSKPPSQPGNKGHPWKNTWQYNLFDGTSVSIIKIDKNFKFKVLKERLIKTGGDKIDMRIMKRQNGKIITVYNSFSLMNPIKNKNIFRNVSPKMQRSCFHFVANGKIKPLTERGFIKIYGNMNNVYKTKPDLWQIWVDYHDSWCTLIYTGELKMSAVGPVFTDGNMLCPKLHQRIEKNICPMEVNGNLYYHYAPDPWRFIDGKSCTFMYPDNSDFFERLRKYVGDYIDGNMGKFKYIRFSGSTPLIHYKGDTYIGIGHYKMKYADIDKNLKDMKPELKAFMTKIKKRLGIESFQKSIPRNQHRALTSSTNGESFNRLFYGWYFYTVNAKTFELDKFSPAFLPQSSKRITLSFPVGLEKHRERGTYMISYHEADSSVWIKEMTFSEIENVLIYNNNTDPKDFKFNIDIPHFKEPIRTKTTKVSCILPTYNRAKYMDHCISLFTKQEFTQEFVDKYGHVELELVIVDDSTTLYKSKGVIPAYPNIVYVPLKSRKTIGEKRNIAVKKSSGDIIIHWDDDDWYHHHRIMYQIEPIMKKDAHITGLTNFALYNACNNKFYTTSPSKLKIRFDHGLQGGTIAYKKKLWDKSSKYPHTSLRENTNFVETTLTKHPKAKIKLLDGKNYYAYVRHTNTYAFNIDNIWKELKTFNMPKSSIKFYTNVVCPKNK